MKTGRTALVWRGRVDIEVHNDDAATTTTTTTTNNNTNTYEQ